MTPDPSLQEDDLVSVARFVDPAELQMARGALEAAGIEVVVQGENANHLYPGSFGGRLLVRSEDEAVANELLAGDASAAASAEEAASE